jgi:hypothetical protein
MRPPDEQSKGVAQERIFDGMFGKGVRFDVLTSVYIGCDGA